ncbi:hypothetical protein JXB12_06205 [candidate division KSB1 bacterium]|nr:hypothetical protein [candidate division KSB1 bacterium]
MLCKRLIFLLLLLAPMTASTQILIPAEGFGSGWKAIGAMRVFSGDNLYGHINGGAELFKEYGFEVLRVQTYVRDEQEIGLEVYEMTCPEAALGIYLARKGHATAHPDISSRNTCNNDQLTVVKSRYYLILSNYSGDAEFVPDMVTLVKTALGNVEETNTDILQQLPDEHRVTGSEYIFRGPYALQPVYTFGEDDIFQLQGKIFGVMADYDDHDGTIYSKLSIEYPDSNIARSVFTSITNKLDPYNKIIFVNDSLIQFSDFQGLFSEIILTDKIIISHINLPELPDVEER